MSAAHWQRGLLGPAQPQSYPTQQQQFLPAAPHGYSQAAPVGEHFWVAAGAAAPPPAAPAAEGRLRSVDELPGPFRTVFAFRYFNAIQNDCWPTLFDSSSNVVVAAPTGGGKTVLLELAILRQLSRNLVPGARGPHFSHKPGHLKAVYLAPSRALVQEKVRDWGQRFGSLGVTCRELTGDTDHEGLSGLDTADIICATPEKFDAVTRGGMRFFADIGLVLIDEVHLLNENRGSSLEGVVARIKMVSKLRDMQAQPIGSVRYIAVSATIPNVQDLADWLAVPPAGIKCFGEEMRPVKLRTVVRGYNPTKTDFLFERRLNDHIYQVVADHSSGKPSLVFCSSRRGTTDTAAQLAKEAARAGAGSSGGGGRSPSVYVRDAGQHQRLQQAGAGLKDGQLQEFVALGVGYHHAAMEPADRAVVEALFVAQDLLVLCTTSTLAMGVNLPARLVVLKGTRRYVGSEAEDASGYQEYERSMCLQMVGRAGRPQFDTEGVAVIMTQRPHVHRYEQLMGGSELVESTLKEVLPEFLNAEITLRTIGDVSQAVDWMRCTYFYIRVKRDPARYGVPQQPSAEALDRWLREKLVLATIQELAQHGMVRLHDDGFGLEPLQPGQIMAERYIRVKTMISLCSVGPGAAIPDLITILSKSAELSTIKLRRSEKKILNEVNHSDRVRYPLMNPAKPSKVLERLVTGADKIYVLINEGLSDTSSDKLDYSLKQDVEQAVSTGRRIATAMVKYFEHTGKAAATFNALLLSKSLRQRLWTDSQQETRQLAGIGPQIAQRLAAAGVTKLKQLAEIEPRKLESLAQRHYPFGNEVHTALAECLPPAISLRCLPVAWLPGGVVELEITVERTGEGRASSPARLLVGSLHDDALLLCRSLALDSFPSPLVLRTRTRTPVKGRNTPVEVVASVVHERLVGVDTAIRTSVPPGVELQGHRCQAPKQLPPGAAQQAQQAQQGGTANSLAAAALDESADRGSAACLDDQPTDLQPEVVPAGTEAAGALHLMQRRLAGSTPAAQPPLQRPPQPPVYSGAAVAAAALHVVPVPAAPPAPAPLTRVVLPRPLGQAANGKSRWSSFVANPAPVPPPTASAPSQQAQPQWGAAGAGQGPWPSQRSALFTQTPSAGSTKPSAALQPAAAANLTPLQPTNRPFAAQPGGLFGRFALGSGSSAAPVVGASLVQQQEPEQQQEQPRLTARVAVQGVAGPVPKRRKLRSLFGPSFGDEDGDEDLAEQAQATEPATAAPAPACRR